MTTASAIILQARMASSRLPGKALANLGGRPIVARCVERLAVRSSMPVILATTTRADDDVLAEGGSGFSASPSSAAPLTTCWAASFRS